MGLDPRVDLQVVLPTRGAGGALEQEQMKRWRDKLLRSGLKPEENIKKPANPSRLVNAAAASLLGEKWTTQTQISRLKGTISLNQEIN